MERDSSWDEGSQSGILDKVRDAADKLMGERAGSEEVDNRMQEDAVAGSGDSGATGDPLYSGTVGVGSADAGSVGGEISPDYGAGMGGGAPDTGLAGRYNEGAEVRSAYDRSTDEPGSYDEGERPDRDETLT